jgi:hypothetical protein
MMSRRITVRIETIDIAQAELYPNSAKVRPLLWSSGTSCRMKAVVIACYLLNARKHSRDDDATLPLVSA